MAPPRGPRSVLWVVKRDHVGDPDRARVDTAGDEAGRVGGVEHEQGADRVGDLAEGPGVDEPGVGGRAGHDQLRASRVLARCGHLVEVDDLARRLRVVGVAGVTP